MTGCLRRPVLVVAKYCATGLGRCKNPCRQTQLVDLTPRPRPAVAKYAATSTGARRVAVTRPGALLAPVPRPGECSGCADCYQWQDVCWCRAAAGRRNLTAMPCQWFRLAAGSGRCNFTQLYRINLPASCGAGAPQPRAAARRSHQVLYSCYGDHSPYKFLKIAPLPSRYVTNAWLACIVWAY